MKIREITNALEDFAPLHLQESYDNTGYQLGNPDQEATGALLCVDITEEIVDEATSRGCNLIITHHPLLFRGVKCVTGRNRPERVLAKALRAGLTVYSCHTAIDSAPGGVSWEMARRLGLTDIQTLVPSGHTHPAGTPGLGTVGNLPAPLTPRELALKVKDTFHTPTLRTSRPSPTLTSITRVALCGGAAAEFLPQAIAAGAQAYITADCKLNQFLDHATDIFLIDAGHYETEECTKQIFFNVIREKFPNFAVCNSEKDKNPIIYL